MIRERTITFYLNDNFGGAEPVGSAIVKYDDRNVLRPSGFVCVCPTCGNAWLKASVSGTAAQRFSPLSSPCRLHGGGLIISDRTYRGVDSRFPIEYDYGCLANDFTVMYDYWVDSGILRVSDLEYVEAAGVPIDGGANWSLKNGSLGICPN